MPDVKTSLVRPHLDAAPAPDSAPSRSDLLHLARPKLATLGLVVVALAYVAARPAPFDIARFLLLLAGSALALCGASALNQVIERDLDALMRRTADRPLPAGRVAPLAATWYGVVLSVAGIGLLYLIGWLTAAIAAAGLLSYLLIYTPLKTRSAASTLVGAAPGAAPALMGWTAVTGVIDARGLALFAILFLWQIPHFLAIAWMYRSDYARAGFVTTAGEDPTGGTTARQILISCAALAPISILPSLLGMTSGLYLVVALGLALYLMRAARRFDVERSGDAARKLLRASVVYLPALLAALVFDVIAFGR